MTKSKTLFFILLELLVGLGFGILGGYLFSLFDPWGDLFYSIFFLFIFILVGILTGIGLVGYFYLKQIGRLDDFIISMTLALVGLVFFAFLATLYHSSILAIILPMTGAIIGFNYKTRRLFRQNISNQLSVDKIIDTEEFKVPNEQQECSDGHIDDSQVKG